MLSFSTHPILDRRGRERQARTLVKHDEIGSFIAKRQTRPMAQNYRITDPEAMAEQLQDSGWLTRVEDSRGRVAKTRKGWDVFLRAWRPETELFGRTARDDSPYSFGALWLCNHSGGRALSGISAMTRLFCLNQFEGAAYRWHHTNAQIDDVLQNLSQWTFEIARQGEKTFTRIDELAQRDRRHEGDAFLNAIARSRPRIAHYVADRMAKERYGSSLWGVMQGLTAVRSTTTAALARLALTDAGWEETREGRVPSLWATVLN